MDHFKSRASELHKDKYSYPKLKEEYVNAKTKITIRCKEHGEFQQTPDNHLQGSGCKECGIEKRRLSRTLTPLEFLKKASDVHGDTYNYSETKYVNAKTKITIKCLIHGPFKQTPNAHLRGNGCTPCGIKKSANKQTKTIEQFIEEARNKHGNKFDYSNVVYINSSTNIKIICPIHKEFLQNPLAHISSMFGCKQCADTNNGLLCRSNTDEFIRKSIIIHGDKYDYTEVKYENSTIDVIIICKIHGSFLQQPGVHLRGNGCTSCGIQKSADCKRYTNEEFIEEARNNHGNLYNYDNIEYTNNRTKIIITCHKHGDFIQTPSSHLQGRGCPDCAEFFNSDRIRTVAEAYRNSDLYSNKIINERQKYKDEFINESKIIHDNKYDYSKVIYENQHTPITIICSSHGEFRQTPNGHLHGGCKLCANEYVGNVRRKSLEKFIQEVSITHNNKYKYEKVIYKNSTTDIIITCPKHGDFTQKPVNHWLGKGCIKCIGRISKISIEWLHMINSSCNKLLYEYHIPNTLFYADGYDSETNTIYEFHGDYWHGNPIIYNSNIINSKARCTMGELYKKTQDKKKRCIELGYNYVEMWESKWHSFKKFIIKAQLRFKNRKI
jgi:hypothetical protein